MKVLIKGTILHRGMTKSEYNAWRDVEPSAPLTTGVGTVKYGIRRKFDGSSESIFEKIDDNFSRQANHILATQRNRVGKSDSGHTTNQQSTSGHVPTSYDHRYQDISDPTEIFIDLTEHTQKEKNSREFHWGQANSFGNAVSSTTDFNLVAHIKLEEDVIVYTNEELKAEEEKVLTGKVGVANESSAELQVFLQPGTKVMLSYSTAARRKLNLNEENDDAEDGYVDVWNHIDFPTASSGGI